MSGKEHSGKRGRVALTSRERTRTKGENSFRDSFKEGHNSGVNQFMGNLERGTMKQTILL